MLNNEIKTPIKARPSGNRFNAVIGIYTGMGTSHSWLWFVDIFERFGLLALRFLTERDIHEQALDHVDVLAVSGGDTFAVAQGMGERGAKELARFIRRGGLYIGSCAGAYLPLVSSKQHLNYFNFVPVKIGNLTKILPKAKQIPEKFCTPYGCSFVFHPVREEVRVRLNGCEPFDRGAGPVLAPLYGGPSLVVNGGSSEILAFYEGFTNKTVFLADRDIAHDTIIGKAAVVREKMGDGHLYLFGPHFEHPAYPEANQLVADVIAFETGAGRDVTGQSLKDDAKTIKGTEARQLLRNIKRELSNSRIVSIGLEMLPVRWMIGKKLYDPVKIRFFIESLWQRLLKLEKWDVLALPGGSDPRKLVVHASDVTLLSRAIKKRIDNGVDSTDLARQIFGRLNIVSTLFLEIYFKSKLLNGGIKHEL